MEEQNNEVRIVPSLTNRLFLKDLSTSIVASLNLSQASAVEMAKDQIGD